MQKQLSEKGAKWMLQLPANTFAELEKLRLVTVVFDVLGHEYPLPSPHHISSSTPYCLDLLNLCLAPKVERRPCDQQGRSTVCLAVLLSPLNPAWDCRLHLLLDSWVLGSACFPLPLWFPLLSSSCPVCVQQLCFRYLVVCCNQQVLMPHTILTISFQESF